MLFFSNIILLLVNAVTSRRILSILFNRVTIMILLSTGLAGCESLFISCLDTGIGVYNGLFHSAAITQSFDLFIYIIGAIILLLTAFYPRRLVEPQNTVPSSSQNLRSSAGSALKIRRLSRDFVEILTSSPPKPHPFVNSPLQCGFGIGSFNNWFKNKQKLFIRIMVSMTTFYISRKTLIYFGIDLPAELSNLSDKGLYYMCGFYTVMAFFSDWLDGDVKVSNQAFMLGGGGENSSNVQGLGGRGAAAPGQNVNLPPIMGGGGAPAGQNVNRAQPRPGAAPGQM